MSNTASPVNDGFRNVEPSFTFLSAVVMREPTTELRGENPSQGSPVFWHQDSPMRSPVRIASTILFGLFVAVAATGLAQRGADVAGDVARRTV